MDERSALWDAVHAERHALADDLERISDGEWSAPSLCPQWSVRDVVAHLVDSATTTRWGFVRQMVTARFDFDRANENGLQRYRSADPRQTLEALRRVADRTVSPPGPLATRLVEAYVHGEDVRRPLGIEGSYPPGHVVTALRYMTRTGATFGGGRERVEGLLLSPSDADDRIGEGAVVEGSSIALLLAASGRPVAPGDLSGPGAETLTSRVS